MKSSRDLPLELWQQIFCSFQSDAESDWSCVSLALTCKTCRCAFALTKKGSCKNAALKRLLQWRAVSNGDYTASGNIASITVHAKLGCRKTARLIDWLETGYIEVSDFLQAQTPCHTSAETSLSLLLAEPPQKQLDKTAVKRWMMEIANFARNISQYQSMELFHSVLGEQHGEVQHVFISESVDVRVHYFPSESDSDSSSETSSDS